MAAWLTVYCTHTVGDITAADLLSAFTSVDFYTVAEGFGIEDEAIVEQALTHLSIKSVTSPSGTWFRLCYRSAEFRPVLVHRWMEPERVQSEREEALEQFDKAGKRGVNRVRKHLAQVVEVVAIELGWSQLDDMGVVFGGQIAEFVATTGNGLIRDQNDDWWAMKDGVPVVLVGPKRRES